MRVRVRGDRKVFHQRELAAKFIIVSWDLDGLLHRIDGAKGSC